MEQFYDLYLPPAATTIDIHSILDAERLLRLHPHWFVEDEKRRDTDLFVSLRDYATEQTFSLGLRLDTTSAPDDPVKADIIMRITLFDFGVQELLFFANQEKTQVRIRYEDEIFNEEREQDILLWVRGIQEYLRLYVSTTPRTVFFRMLMNRMVLQMNPSQRKICLMITKITVVELVVILIIVIGYVSFGQ
jgi:hypothetical protein